MQHADIGDCIRGLNTWSTRLSGPAYIHYFHSDSEVYPTQKPISVFFKLKKKPQTIPIQQKLTVLNLLRTKHPRLSPFWPLWYPDSFSSLASLAWQVALTDDAVLTPLLSSAHHTAACQGFVCCLSRAFSLPIFSVRDGETRRNPSVKLSISMRFCSGLFMFMVTLIRLSCVLEASIHLRGLLIAHSSSSFRILARKGFTTLVTVLMKTSLVASAVSSRCPRGSRTSLYSPPAPAPHSLSLQGCCIQPSSTDRWPLLTVLLLLSFFLSMGIVERPLSLESGHA